MNEAIRRTISERVKGVYGFPSEIAIIALAYPIIRFAINNIGLPWLMELTRYSELWRQKLHTWIDREYLRQGFDPAQAKALGDALLRDLQATKDEEAQAAWQRLADALSEDSGE